MAARDGFDEETTLGDILSAGPQPTIEKGVTKLPTRNALQNASTRKETALRRVLAAQTRRGYVADHLVHPVCHGVLRRHDSTGTQLKLALEIIRRANCPPESERALADTIRAGLATRLVDSASTHDDDRAHPTTRLEAHLMLLAHAPPRLAAAILWADRRTLIAYMGRDSHTHGVNPGSRAAAGGGGGPVPVASRRAQFHQRVRPRGCGRDGRVRRRCALRACRVAQDLRHRLRRER